MSELINAYIYIYIYNHLYHDMNLKIRHYPTVYVIGTIQAVVSARIVEARVAGLFRSGRTCCVKTQREEEDRGNFNMRLAKKYGGDYVDV